MVGKTCKTSRTRYIINFKFQRIYIIRNGSECLLVLLQNSSSSMEMIVRSSIVEYDENMFKVWTIFWFYFRFAILKNRLLKMFKFRTPIYEFLYLTFDELVHFMVNFRCSGHFGAWGTLFIVFTIIDHGHTANNKDNKESLSKIASFSFCFLYISSHINDYIYHKSKLCCSNFAK